MMSSQISFVKAKNNFAQFMDEVTNNREPVIIKRQGKEDVALIAASDLSSMEETLYLLISPNNRKRLLTALNRAQSRTQKPVI